MYKLLVVEDEVLIRDIIKEYFATRDYEVIEAVDGYDALEKVNQDIDMVLLDMKHVRRSVKNMICLLFLSVLYLKLIIC